MVCILADMYLGYGMVWFGLVWFGLFLLLSVTHVTLDIPITDYNLYIITLLIIYGCPSIIIYNTNFKDKLEVEYVTTSRHMCMYINIHKR